MKKIFAITFLLIGLTLPACAGTKEFMKKALSSWEGYSIDDVIAHWGYPHDEKNIANRHLLIWRSSKNIYIPQSSTANVNNNYYNTTVNSTTYGGYTQNYYCTKTFEVDDKNMIIGWQWEGNNCPAMYVLGNKQLVNPQNDPWAKEKAIKDAQRAEKKRLKQELN